MPHGPAHAYSYQVICANGIITRESKPAGVDPQDPPTEYGRPMQVILTPMIASLPMVQVDIPIGCKPVCHRLVQHHIGNGQEPAVVYRAGWWVGKRRLYTEIDVATGARRDNVADYEGRG